MKPLLSVGGRLLESHRLDPRLPSVEQVIERIEGIRSLIPERVTGYG